MNNLHLHSSTEHGKKNCRVSCIVIFLAVKPCTSYVHCTNTHPDSSARLCRSHITQYGVAVRVHWGYSAATALRSSSCWSSCMQHTLQLLPTCSSHSGTELYETYIHVAGWRNLDAKLTSSVVGIYIPDLCYSFNQKNLEPPMFYVLLNNTLICM